MSETTADIVTFRLSPAAKKALGEIMARTGASTIQEAVRRAIRDELFLQRRQADGWKVTLERGNKLRKVIWPAPAPRA